MNASRRATVLQRWRNLFSFCLAGKANFFALFCSWTYLAGVELSIRGFDPHSIVIYVLVPYILQCTIISIPKLLNIINLIPTTFPRS